MAEMPLLNRETVTLPLIVMLCQLLPKLLPKFFWHWVSFGGMFLMFVILHKQTAQNGLLPLVVTSCFVEVAQIGLYPRLGW